MNPPSDFESQLRELRPQSPSVDLRQRLAAELSPPPGNPRTVTRVPSSVRPWMLTIRALAERLVWAGLGATALWFAQGVWKPTAPTSTQVSRTESASIAQTASSPLQDIKPTTQEEEISVADEGVRFSSDGAALRKIRHIYLEKTSWPDPANGGALEVQWPREELVYLPVPVQ